MNTPSSKFDNYPCGIGEPYIPNRTPFFNTPERIALLEERAKAWIGTPWRQNSMAVGVGVSCHNLPRALYAEAGFADFPDVGGSPAQATALNTMKAFLDGRPELQSIPWNEQLQAGDLLGLFIPMNNVGARIRKRTVNHLGVVLENQRFVHTLLKRNTMIDFFETPPWVQLVVDAWRPIETGSLSA